MGRSILIQPMHTYMECPILISQCEDFELKFSHVMGQGHQNISLTLEPEELALQSGQPSSVKWWGVPSGWWFCFAACLFVLSTDLFGQECITFTIPTPLTQRISHPQPDSGSVMSRTSRIPRSPKKSGPGQVKSMQSSKMDLMG